MDELKSLAEAADYVVLDSVEQVRVADSRFQIGRGKAEELAELVKDLNINKIIFDNDLTPDQQNNLATVTGVETIDRFQLILEIFAKRASTNEAKLQIKLAKLRYQLPRAKASVKFTKMGERPGFLGRGMYDADVFVKTVKKQIVNIKKELKKISEKRKLHRVRRIKSGFFLISLAGYTNAGKTTLFNALARESKPSNSGLFTTLSTTTRLALFKGRKALLTDTVGFIDRLPVVMVEAFHSTLEETILADVIILIVDIHEPPEIVQRKLVVCLDTIREIGAGGIPIITALNKIDLLTQDEIEERRHIIARKTPHPVEISALKGIKMEELKQSVVKYLGNVLTAMFILPLNDLTLSFISSLYSQVYSVETFYEGQEVKVLVKASPRFMDEIKRKMKGFEGQLIELKER